MDMIDRQQAIDALDKRFDSIPMEQTSEILLLRKDLRELPTVEPKRIRGRWIYSSYDDESGFDESWTCDKCGYTTNIEETNFCPNCGSYNRGEKNDQ